MVVAAIAFTFTACSKSGNHEGDAAEVVDGAAGDVADAAGDAAEAVEGAAGDVAEAAGDAAGDAAEAVEGAAGDAAATASASWSAGLDEWVTGGSGVKTITLDGIAGEGELSAEGQAQLNLIATVLENNEGVSAVIKGHTPADQKIGNGKPRAVWTKAKLIMGHDAVGSRISTEGAGSKEPIEGVDANDPSQKRITVSFSK